MVSKKVIYKSKTEIFSKSKLRFRTRCIKRGYQFIGKVFFLTIIFIWFKIWKFYFLAYSFCLFSNVNSCSFKSHFLLQHRLMLCVCEFFLHTGNQYPFSFISIPCLFLLFFFFTFFRFAILVIFFIFGSEMLQTWTRSRSTYIHTYIKYIFHQFAFTKHTP